jgi:hypothetical protein
MPMEVLVARENGLQCVQNGPQMKFLCLLVVFRVGSEAIYLDHVEIDANQIDPLVVDSL